MKMKKYHGLGNDYLIIDASELKGALSEAAIQLVCSAHYGAGSDGILTGPFLPGSPDFEDIRAKSGVSVNDAAACLCALRILNPDGSEAEKSGNGLRIFTRYLYDCGMARLNEPFSMLTLGGKVTATVLDPQDGIRVDMGGVRFISPDFPFQKAEDKTCKVTVDGNDFTVCCATVGNPHCIVLDKEVDEANPELVARRYSQTARMCSSSRSWDGMTSSSAFGNAGQGTRWPLAAAPVPLQRSRSGLATAIPPSPSMPLAVY